MNSVIFIHLCKHYNDPILLWDKVMGSCLCKEKKTKSSRTAGGGEESYARNTTGGGFRGNQTDTRDKRARAGARSSDIINEERDVTPGGAVPDIQALQDRDVQALQEIFRNDRSVTRLNSESM